ERDHELLAFGETTDRVRHEVHALLREQRAQRIGVGFVVVTVVSEALLAAAEPQVLEREERHLADLAEQLLVLPERQLELAGDLLFGGRTAQAPFELVRDLLDERGLLAHAARYPVERAEMVEDGAADAELRVGREERFLLRVVLLDRVEQADDPPRHQVVELDVRRFPHREPLDHPADEREIAAQHVLAIALRRGVADAASRARARRTAGVGVARRRHAQARPSISRRKKNWRPPVTSTVPPAARRSAVRASASAAGAPGSASTIGICARTARA